MPSANLDLARSIYAACGRRQVKTVALPSAAAERLADGRGRRCRRRVHAAVGGPTTDEMSRLSAYF
jgi:hypothetical protein